MFKGTMTKWPVQKLTQGTTQKLFNEAMISTVVCIQRSSDNTTTDKIKS